MSLQNSIQELNEKWILKTNLPEWFNPMLKTLLSRNITIHTWNDLAKCVENVVSDTTTVKDFVNTFTNSLESGDLSKLITKVSRIPYDEVFDNIVLTYINNTEDSFLVPNIQYISTLDTTLKELIGDDLNNIITVNNIFDHIVETPTDDILSLFKEEVE